MAVPVIASSSTSVFAKAASITLTKPTGLAEGDGLCAVCFISNDGGGATGSITAPSGWTTASSLGFAGASTVARLFVFYKEASSGDAAAANFVFTVNASDYSAGVLFRVTGGNPTDLVESAITGEDTSDTSPAIFSGSYTPNQNDNLLVMAILGRDPSLSAGISAYTISGTNPIWTEYFDDDAQDSDYDHQAAVAVAPLETAREITTWGATLSNGVAVDHSGSILFAIPAPASASDTPTSISLTGSAPNPTVQAAVTVAPESVALLGTTPIETPTLTTNTKYTNTVKPTTTWTNTEK